MKRSIYGGFYIVILPILALLPGCGGGGGTVSPLPTSIPTSSPTTVLFTDAFLFDNGGQPSDDFNGFTNWNVTNGTVDLRGGKVSGASDQTNGRYVDLDGDTAGRFATKQTIAFTGGASYKLSFSYKSTDGNSNSATATIGSNTFNVTTNSTTMQTFSQNFTASSTSLEYLVFQDAGDDGAGIGIDNITVSLNE